MFHDNYGYRNNNIKQFQEFILRLLKKDLTLKSMPISSQAHLEGGEGSETRVYQEDILMKLHERLERIAKKINNFL